MTAIQRARLFLSEEDAAPIRDGMARHDANWARFEQEWERLIREHWGEWVAVNEGKFLYSLSLEGVVEAVRAAGWPMSTTVVRRAAERDLRI
jgi:hypothetical protein